MKSAVLPALLLALAACDDAKDAARSRGLPDACCVGGPEDPDRAQIVSKAFLRPGAHRSFSVRISARLADLPAGVKKLRLWFPVPSDSTIQSVTKLAFSVPAKVGVEPKYGNKIAFWESPPAEVWMTFDCARTEILTELARVNTDGRDDASAFEVFRKADRLAILDSEVGRLSDHAVHGKTTAVGKARALYEFVLSNMTLDPAADGAGRGSTAHAREKKRGDSTDFHALFNSLARSQGIASGFEVGLAEGSPGAVRAWAFFRAPGKTWVPVDCVEGSLHPERKNDFFGGLPADRVALSTGRDLTLVPEQEDGPLNFFGAPYAEADGKPVRTEMSWSFKRLD